VLSSYQRRLGERLGVRPGAEMLAAIERAASIGARLVLADRDIQATLKRTWAALSVWDSVQLVGTLIGSMFAQGEITPEQVEALKDRDTISELIREFAEVMPRLERPLIDERDRYLMSSIRDAPGQRVVAVVGAGHVGGMVSYLNAEVDRDELNRIPPPSVMRRLSRYMIPLFALSSFAHAYAARGAPGLQHLALWWLACNCAVTLAFTLLARPRLLAALGAALVAPLAALVPPLGVGTTAGRLEALLRRPSVADCEALSQIATRRDWFDNRFTRVLLVAFAATLGGLVGACIAVCCVLLLSILP